MKHDIHNGQDIIDSRDVIARIEELETASCAECGCSITLDASSIKPDGTFGWLDDSDSTVCGVRSHAPDDDHAEELQQLRALASEAEGCADWQYGETLIRDSYFRTYAEELASDVCDMKQASGWPFRHIDWDAAAEELQQDYTSVDFAGVTYWIRS